MDDTISALNIDGIIRVGSERLLADDGIVDKVLTDGITVFQRHAPEAGQVGRGDGARGDISPDDVQLHDVGGDGTAEELVGFEGGIGGGEYGEGTGAGDLVGHSGGLEGGVEFAKVFVSLEVALLLADGNACEGWWSCGGDDVFVSVVVVVVDVAKEGKWWFGGK